jgi:hypothetical protein
MGELITLISFRDAVEAEIVKGRLEAYGIECYLKDSGIVSAHPFYANPVGGIKLQVWEEDVKQALEVIREVAPESFREGEITEDDIASKSEKFLTKFLEPIYSKPGMSLKIASVTIVLAVIITSVIIALSQPSTVDKLSSGYWKVYQIIYKDSTITSQPIDAHSEYSCGNETIVFMEDGNCKLPSFSKYPAIGKWNWVEETLEIESDTLKEFYSGKFSVKFFNGSNSLLLQSQNTSINCVLCKWRK